MQHVTNALLLAGAGVLATVASAATPQPARTYKPLRFDESWSWLATNPPAQADVFDPVKHVELGGEWHLTLGGSTRLRFESDSNRTLGASSALDDDLARFRSFLHWELGRPGFRWFAEARYADTWSSERTVSALYRDDPDFENFFFEGTLGRATTHPVTIRAGRQELLFGVERVVGPLDWVSTRRTFDGISVTVGGKKGRTVVFATRPVKHEIHDIDSPDSDRTFLGVDWTRKHEAHAFEAYALGLHDSRDTFLGEDGKPDDVTLRTFGGRYELMGPRGAVAEVEGNVQDGNRGTDEVSAWSLAVTGGFQWKEAKGKPKVTAGFDLATGDADPADGKRQTFDQLFPTGHPFLGHVDLVGRQNVEAIRARFEAWPRQGLKVDAAVHRFRLDEARDALYDAGGNLVRKDATGAAGRSVATELDVLVSYAWDTHHSVAGEICKWWSDDFIERTGSAGDATFVWLGYEFKF